MKEAYEKLMESEEYQDWDEKDETHWSHAFIMPSVPEWQFGFYNPDKDKVTTFFVKEDVKKSPETDMMKKDHIVKELDMDKVEKSYSDILEQARNKCKENDEYGEVQKEIVILQNLVEEGQVWNITLMTEGFKVVNYKINSETGDVEKETTRSIFEFKQDQPGANM